MRASIALIAGVLMACVPLFAHHGSAAYDLTRSVTFEATVTEFILQNPHSMIFFDARDENGKVVHWVSEFQAPGYLLREGWTRNSIKPGDHITVVANPNKKANIRTLYGIKVILPNGQELLNIAPR